MDEWQYEMAQQRETDERNAAIEEVRQRAAQRFKPYMLDGEACCPDCLEPLPEHRLDAGICVGCLTIREQLDGEIAS